MTWSDQTAVVIDRRRGLEGELQLQRRGEEYEVIYNGLFLMATYNGASEKAAIRDALKIAACRSNSPVNVLMGGLGVGYSLQEALAWKQVARVTVAEIEPAIIRWNRDVLRKINNNALYDPRTKLLNIDFREALEEEAETALRHPSRRYKVIMIDTDNGSSWLSLPSNAFFYSTDGLQLISTCLYPGGVACFWCSRREKAFEKQLDKKFHQVSFHSVEEKTGYEGCYYLARKE